MKYTADTGFFPNLNASNLNIPFPLALVISVGDPREEREFSKNSDHGRRKNSQHMAHLAASTRLHRESREFSEAC